MIFVPDDNHYPVNMIRHDDECIQNDMHVGADFRRFEPVIPGDFSDFR